LHLQKSWINLNRLKLKKKKVVIQFENNYCFKYILKTQRAGVSTIYQLFIIVYKTIINNSSDCHNNFELINFYYITLIFYFSIIICNEISTLQASIFDLCKLVNEHKLLSIVVNICYIIFNLTLVSMTWLSLLNSSIQRIITIMSVSNRISKRYYNIIADQYWYS